MLGSLPDAEDALQETLFAGAAAARGLGATRPAPSRSAHRGRVGHHAGDPISAIALFDTAVLPHFGLPRTLPVS